MIDFHSHILAKIDDGSHDIDESIQLINLLSSQGVKTVIATPHFYANDEPVEHFLSRRKKAFDSLCENLPSNAPKILLGAEVKYYQGISRMESLDSLCISGTNLLLLEMPFTKWTEYTMKELIELVSLNNVTVVLAHIERYLKLQGSKTLNRFLDCGILMQTNASSFVDIFSRRKALKLLRDGKVQVIGSDCHNLNSRPPQMDKAFEIIRKKFGENFINQFNEFCTSLLV